MKLYSWNVNGIRAVWNKGLFQKFIEEHNPDILCLQETKAQPDQSPVDLPNYIEYWHSAEKKGYSGTAIFTKTEPLSVQNGYSETIQAKYDFADKFGDTSKEGRVLTLEFKDFYVTTVYTPNSKDKLERLEMREKIWGPAYQEHIAELQKKKPVLACGDFNVAHQEIDLARPDANVGKHGFTDEERKDFTDLLGTGVIDTFRTLHPDQKDAYTWWTAWGGARARNVGWRIDYWLASEALQDRIKSADIHADVMGSDHCPISIEII
ncbi:exodeoxyribonuclease III [Candidatus Saccharibacteria bacterium]|nr:exodeoxyribonuclease III [Candidatus Saccharibacteria bacterium]